MAAKGHLIPINSKLVTECISDYIERGWSIAEIATAGCLHVRTLSGILSGTQKWVRSDTLRKFANAWGLEPIDLVSPWSFHQNITQILSII